ncbi:MAG TPA: heat-inducible transcriptional repressor HrcA [Acidimicrobiales bacterium]|nr:heat-inducible transcriptional repressor HrcA [Acidimicrobiales bacterium]
MLDDRKAAVLRAVVEGYIETAQPVGSAHVVRAGGIEVSSATVRNDMVVLEREGYLMHPHTSAGRIPTDKGYRFFVDQLAPSGALEPVHRQRIRDFFNMAHGELEQMLHDTTQLLSSLTDYAAVVIGPSHEAASVRSVQLVALGPRAGLLVVVLANGVVEKRSIDLAEGTGDERVASASAHLAKTLIGSTLTTLPPLVSSGDASTDAIVAECFTALARSHDEEPDHVFVGGASRMAAAFDAVDTVRQVLDTLEKQFVVVSLLRDVMDRGLSVAIGVEHGLVPLAECSVVVAPYELEGELAGTIGVLGPTRMNYPQAMAAVAVVSQRLGRHLTEG